MVVEPAKLEAVIFDLDGLLIDSEPIWARVEARFLERRGLHYDQEIARQYLGRRVIDLIGDFQRDFGIRGEPEALLQEWVDDYLQLTAQGIPLRPGAQEAVQELSSRYRLAIASSSPLHLIRRVVKLFHWEDYLTAVQSGDQVKHGKPAPDIFLAAAAQLGVGPARCLVLEDSLAGVSAAKAAGMFCFAVPNLDFYPAEAYGEADAIYPTLHEVRHALLG